jgi:hypothetical protein
VFKAFPHYLKRKKKRRRTSKTISFLSFSVTFINYFGKEEKKILLTQSPKVNQAVIGIRQILLFFITVHHKRTENVPI